MRFPLRARFVLLAVSTLLLLASTPVRAEFQPAKRTHAPELKPPAQQAGAGIEGWALVCVTVKADGTTANPRVIDVSPNTEFAEAGREASRGWKFRSAQVDGAAVEQSDVCGIQLFTVGSPVDEKTNAKLDEATRLLDENEGDDDAVRLLKGLEVDGPLTLKQAARLQMLRYRIAAEKKNEEAAAQAIERASIGGGRFLEGDDRVNALGATFHAYVNQRRYREALALFATFESIDGGAKPMVVHGKTAADIRDLSESDKSYTVPAKLEPALAAEGGVWHHRPFRRELGARKLEGKIDAFVIDCDRRTLSLDYQEDVSWKIPESWGDCTVYAEGTPGTTFELIEYGPQKE